MGRRATVCDRLGHASARPASLRTPPLSKPHNGMRQHCYNQANSLLIGRCKLDSASVHGIDAGGRKETEVRSHGAEHQRKTAGHAGGAAGFTSFMFGLPRWPALAGLWARGPLVRTTDRIEALVLLLAIVMSAAFLPLAAVLGSTVYDTQRDRYAEQAAVRTAVPAVITEVPDVTKRPRSRLISAPARWSVNGVEHTGSVLASSATEPGDTVEIWVDPDGKPVSPPGTPGRAALEAIMVAALAWVGLSGATALLYLGVRAVCDRIRLAQWQTALEDLVGPR